MKWNPRIFWLPLLFGVVASILHAEIPGTAPAPSGEDLYRTVAALDAALFDAYNRCDLEAFGALLAEDLEFYHDQGGLMIGRQATVDAVRKNICGIARRELVAGSLKVFPMHGFGALEMGVHRFYQPKISEAEPTGEAQFVQLWRHRDGVWQVTRIFSYDHRALHE